MPAGMAPSNAPGHHTPDFYIDDSRLDVGVKAFCQIVFDYPVALAREKKKAAGNNNAGNGR
jgi:hypothetical protein